MKIENMIKAMTKRKPIIAKDGIQIEINQHVTIKNEFMKGIDNWDLRSGFEGQS